MTRIAALLIFLGGCCTGTVPAAPTPVVATPVAPAAPAVPTATVGTAVLANYHALGWYYVGVVTAVTGDQVSILYADGDTETMPASGTLPDRLAAPMPAEWFDGTAYVPVTIEHRTGHALGLLFPDGRRQWAGIGQVRVSADALPAAAPPPAVAVAFGEPGSIVLARYSVDDYWYEAVVGEIVGDQRRVVYADGASEDRPMDALRAGGITVGARVESREHGTPNVTAGTVLRRIEHGVEVQLDGAGGAPGVVRWSALGDVRIAP